MRVRRSLLAGLSLAVLAAGCGDATAPQASPTSTPTPAPPATPPAVGWRELPPGPLSPREDPVALWTGAEGGPPRGAAVVWAGDELVLWGGTRWDTSTAWTLLDAGWVFRPGR